MLLQLPTALLQPGQGGKASDVLTDGEEVLEGTWRIGTSAAVATPGAEAASSRLTSRSHIPRESVDWSSIICSKHWPSLSSHLSSCQAERQVAACMSLLGCSCPPCALGAALAQVKPSPCRHCLARQHDLTSDVRPAAYESQRAKPRYQY